MSLPFLASPAPYALRGRAIFVNRYFAPDISATSQMLSDACFALAARGFRIAVVTSRSAYDSPDLRLPAHEVINGVEVHRVWTTRFGRKALAGRACDYLSFYLSAFWLLLWMARRQDVLVAKTDPPLLGVLVAAAARVKGARLVNWLQDVFPEVAIRLGVLRDGPAARVLRGCRNWSLRRACRNVAIGARMAALLEAEGAPPSSIHIIQNWADAGLISPVDAAENPLRQAWGLVGKFVVGYSGNLGRAHEFDTMLGAAEALLDEPSVVFLFIGGGHGNQQLRAVASARGLSNVQFMPYQPQALLGQSLSVPDVHLVSLLPAMEGLIVPSKIYGIAAAGRPAIFIGDSAGEVATQLNTGGFGLSVQPGDSQALTAAIRALQRAPEMCREQGRRARAFFEQGQTSEHAAERWARLLTAISPLA